MERQLERKAEQAAALLAQQAEQTKEWERERRDQDHLRRHHATLQQEFSEMMELSEHRQRELRSAELELARQEESLARRERSISDKEEEIYGRLREVRSTHARLILRHIGIAF